MHDKTYQYITCGLAVLFFVLLIGLASVVTPVVHAGSDLPDHTIPAPGYENVVSPLNYSGL